MFKRILSFLWYILPAVLSFTALLILVLVYGNPAHAQAQRQQSLHSFTIQNVTSDSDIDSVVEVLSSVAKEDFLLVLSTQDLSRLTGYGHALLTPEGARRTFQFLRSKCSDENPCLLLIDRAGKQS